MRRLVPCLLLLAACRQLPSPPPDPLAGVNSWAMQLQGLEEPGAVTRLVDSTYDLLVLEATNTVRGSEGFATRALVERLHARGKRVLVYLNVGQAEDYRGYWQKNWRPPGRERPGEPSFLITVDPDGWEGNYPVAYWEPRWKRLLFELVDRAVADGFDGAYLDWILGYEEPAVVAAAKRANTDPARAMADLVRDLRAHARRKNPTFVVIPQNGGELADRVPEFLNTIDGYSVEPLSFAGSADADWKDSAAGDKPLPATGDWSTESLGRTITEFRTRGLPVLTVDYAIDPRNAAAARNRSRALGAIPFISRTPLDRLP